MYYCGPLVCDRRVVIVIGLTLHALGHLGLWAVITGRITLPYWQVRIRWRPIAAATILASCMVFGLGKLSGSAGSH